MRTFGIRYIKDGDEIYFHADDIMQIIRNHADGVLERSYRETGKPLSPMKEGYKLAHNHMVEILTVERAYVERIEELNK